MTDRLTAEPEVFVYPKLTTVEYHLFGSSSLNFLSFSNTGLWWPSRGMTSKHCEYKKKLGQIKGIVDF